MVMGQSTARAQRHLWVQAPKGSSKGKAKGGRGGMDNSKVDRGCLRSTIESPKKYFFESF